MSKQDDKYLVCGGVRSGSSMLMRLLEHCQLTPLHNKKRKNWHNPNGYYELKGKLNRGHFESISGGCLKVLGGVKNIPKDMDFTVLLTKRNTRERAVSWRIFTPKFDRTVDKIEKKFKRDEKRVLKALQKLPRCTVHIFDYNRALKDPEAAYRYLEDITGGVIDRSLGLIDPKLYRKGQEVDEETLPDRIVEMMDANRTSNPRQFVIDRACEMVVKCGASWEMSGDDILYTGKMNRRQLRAGGAGRVVETDTGFVINGLNLIEQI